MTATEDPPNNAAASSIENVAGSNGDERRAAVPAPPAADNDVTAAKQQWDENKDRAEAVLPSESQKKKNGLDDDGGIVKATAGKMIPAKGKDKSTAECIRNPKHEQTRNGTELPVVDTDVNADVVAMQKQLLNHQSSPANISDGPDNNDNDPNEQAQPAPTSASASASASLAAVLGTNDFPAPPAIPNQQGLPGAYVAGMGREPLRLVPARVSQMPQEEESASNTINMDNDTTVSSHLGSTNNNGNHHHQQQHPQVNESGLVEARAVTDDPCADHNNIAHATLHDEEEERSRNKSNNNINTRYYHPKLLLVVVPFLAGLAIFLTWWGGAWDLDEKNNDNSNNAPGENDSLWTNDELYVRQYLPEETLLALVAQNNDTDLSPQFRAFQWVQQDPSLYQYSPRRLRQRFALATFFYSTNHGTTTWTARNQWLSYSIHECEWYFRGRFYIFGLSQTATSPCQSLDDPIMIEENDERNINKSNAGDNSNSSTYDYDDNSEDSYYKLLWLPFNNIVGSIPNELFWLTGLQSIDFSRGASAQNNLTGTISPNITQLTNLRQLSLYGNELTGTIPDLSALNQTLTVLYLNNNRFYGTLTADFFVSGRNLAQLTLNENWLLTGTVPTEIGLLSHLFVLGLSDTSLKGTIPTEFGQLTSLVFSYNQRNQWTGTLPTEIGRASQLTWLHFYGNQLSGAIPTEIGLMQSLTEVRLDGNLLSSTLPTELGLLTALTRFDVGQNDVTGSIVSELGLCSGVTHIELSENRLTGPIPSELGGLTNLLELWLQSNDLLGELPTSLPNLMTNGSIEFFDVSDTNVFGIIPEDFCDLGMNMSFDCNSDWLCGCDCPCSETLIEIQGGGVTF